MSRVRGVEVDGRLEPRLTKRDLRVLRKMPSACEASQGAACPTVWRIAEELGALDIREDVLPLLEGLRHFGYIDKSIPYGRHKIHHWYRLPKGGAALRDTGGQTPVLDELEGSYEIGL